MLPQLIRKHWTSLLFDKIEESTINNLVKGLKSPIKERRTAALENLLDLLSSDQENHLLFIQDGGVKPLLKLIKKHNGIHRVEAIRVLILVSREQKKIREILINNKIIPMLVPLLSHNYPPEVKQPTIRLIYYLSLEPVGRTSLLAQDIITYIFKLDLRNIWILKLLGDLVQNNDIPLNIIIQNSLFMNTFKIVLETSNIPDLFKFSVKLLALLLELDQTLCHACSSAIDYKPLLHPLFNNDIDNECRSWMMRCISKLVYHLPCKIGLIFADGYSIISEILRSEDDICKAAAVEAIAHLSSSEFHQVRSVVENSITPIIGCLDTKVTRIRIWSARALSNIAKTHPGMDLVIAQSGGLNLIGKSIMESSNISVVMLDAFKSIIFSSPQNHEQAMLYLNNVITLLYSKASDKMTIMKCLEILFILIENSIENQIHVLDLDPLRNLIFITEAYCSVPEVSKLTWKIIQIIYNNDIYLKEIILKGGLWSALKTFKKNPEPEEELKLLSRILHLSEKTYPGCIKADDIEVFLNLTTSKNIVCQIYATKCTQILTEISLVYNLQMVEMENIKNLLDALNETEYTEVIKNVSQTLNYLSSSNTENKMIIASFGTLFSLSQSLNKIDVTSREDVLNAMGSLADANDSYLYVLDCDNVIEFVSHLMLEKGNDINDNIVILFGLLTKYITENKSKLMDPVVLEIFIANLQKLTISNDRENEKMALNILMHLVDGPFLHDEAIAAKIFGFTSFLQKSDYDAISSKANDVFFNMVSKSKMIIQEIQNSEISNLIPFLNSNHHNCAKVLDALINRAEKDTDALTLSHELIEAKGIIPLVNILSFGNNKCKIKASKLIADLSCYNMEFQRQVILADCIQPLVKISMSSDSECKNNAKRALNILTTKDLVDKHKEKSKGLFDLFGNTGEDIKTKLQGIFKNLEDFCSSALNSEHTLAQTSNHSSDKIEDEREKIRGEAERKFSGEIPSCLMCPITYDIMSDPVIASDGHTYERDAIEKWLVHHNSSPMSNEIMSSHKLIPNHVVKDLIRKYTK